MESSVYKLGELRGELRGEQRGEQKTFVRVYEQRLGRALTTDERATLVTRLGTLGFDRLADQMFDLSPDALAAWLGDPNAT